MEDQLVSYRIAKLAKDKGFKEWCDFAYRSTDNEEQLMAKSTWRNGEIHDSHKGFCTAPTQSLLQKWLREVKNYVVIVTYDHSNPEKPYSVNGGQTAPCIIDIAEHDFNSYEDALEEGLLQALELV